MGPYERYVGGYRIYHFSVLALSAMSNVAMSDDMEWTVVSDSMLWKARHMNDEIDRRLDYPIALGLCVVSRFRSFSSSQRPCSRKSGLEQMVQGVRFERTDH
jgi:hypothetical protein